MSSEEISLNGLNSQLVFQEEALRSFSCHQQQNHHHHHHHHHRGSVAVGGVASAPGGGDPGPKTRELTGFIDDKMFSSVDRDRFFRPQPSIFADHPPDRHRDHPQQQQQEPRDWNNNNVASAAAATSASTDESDGDDEDDVVDDEDEEEEEEVDEAQNNNNNNKSSSNTNNLNSHSNSANCNNNNTTTTNNNNSGNCSVATPVGDKLGNGKAKQISTSFGKNGNAMQTVNNGAIVTVAEADGDLYYSQYLQGATEGSSGSGQKECVVVDNGCGISGSGDSLRAILSDPVM